MRRRKGFTLMELIIVVIIIGILAMIGLPQYFKTAERARSAEAFDTLGGIRSAMLRYAMSSADGKSTNLWTNLDLDPPAAAGTTYFNAPTLGPIATCNGTSVGVVGTIVRKGTKPYTITVQCGNPVGQSPFKCSAGGVNCPPLPN